MKLNEQRHTTKHCRLPGGASEPWKPFGTNSRLEGEPLRDVGHNTAGPSFLRSAIGEGAFDWRGVHGHHFTGSLSHARPTRPWLERDQRRSDPICSLWSAGGPAAVLARPAIGMHPLLSRCPSGWGTWTCRRSHTRSGRSESWAVCVWPPRHRVASFLGDFYLTHRRAVCVGPTQPPLVVLLLLLLLLLPVKDRLC